MIKPTSEQEEILCSDDMFITVNALAGTGKSKLLWFLSQRFRFRKIIYFVFDNGMKTEAGKIFHDNVKITTFHSYVYGFYKDRYPQLADNPSSYFISKLLEKEVLPGFNKDDRMLLAREVNKSLSVYLSSRDANPGRKHISYKRPKNSSLVNSNIILKYLKLLWTAMIDNRFVKMSFDGVLKLFYLDKKMIPFDIILCDEVQDFTDVMVAIVERQIHAKRILVGDRFQDIYSSFRHTGGVFTNPLINEQQVHYLTQSFRCSVAIANCANQLLKRYLDCPVDYQGVNNSKGILGLTPGPYMHIFKTNYALLDELVSLKQNNIPVRIAGNLKQYDFNLLTELFFVSSKESIGLSNYKYKGLTSIDEIKDKATILEDFQTIQFIKLMDKHGVNLMTAMQNVFDEHLVMGDAGVTLTTAHRAKGLESESVRMGYDFLHPNLLANEGNKTGLMEIYVAMTRAKTSLCLPSHWYKV